MRDNQLDRETALVRWGLGLLGIGLAAALGAYGDTPQLTLQAVSNQGVDLLVDGELVAPIRLAANGAIVADQVVMTNSTSILFSNLQAADGAAVTFATNDYVSITLPAGASNGPTVFEPVVEFHLTVVSFHSNLWVALFPPGQPAPFHFLACSMPTAQVWHQRGWLNATPYVDLFPLLEDVHGGTPEISCLWNRNWSYICPLGGHPIPMIGLWDPATNLYVGYDFQGTRATDQSERDIATAYCWEEGGMTNFITLAYPDGGTRYGLQKYPQSGAVLASEFMLEINMNLPSTEDPNEQFQERLFARYTNALPAPPAMNDLGWIPGVVRQQDFAGPVGLTLYGKPAATDYYSNNTVQLYGLGGHREMPVDTALVNNQMNDISSARSQLGVLLTNYGSNFTVGGDACLYWTKPLAGGWLSDWGGSNVTTLHDSEGWFTARVLVELYRYDLSRNKTDTNYLQAIDETFNWAKHFVWSRNEIPDVPSCPFGIGVTLSAAFLLDYYYTFKDDPSWRATNAPLALHLARNLIWRYLNVWAMDSNTSDGAIDSAFLAEPNSGRDWACLGCANELSWLIDSITQVYVSTGDARMRYYLRGMLQRWPILYRPIFKASLANYMDRTDSLAEGYGLYTDSGPGPGNHYNYGFAEALSLEYPVSNSIMRVVAGAAACIAFDKGTTGCDVTNYGTDGNGDCSFQIVSRLGTNFDVSFSYPFVNLWTQQVSLVRNGTTNVLGTNGFHRSTNSPSSLYLKELGDGDVVIIGNVPATAGIIPIDTPLVFSEANLQPLTNGSYTALPLVGSDLLAQDWNNFHSFAGLVPGTHWDYGIPYQQSLHAVTNSISVNAPSGTAYLVVYAPPEDGPFQARPAVILDDGTTNWVSGNPVLDWRGWPSMFDQMILMDYVAPAPGRLVRQVAPEGTSVMALTVFTGGTNAWMGVQSNLATNAAAFAQKEEQICAQTALQSSFGQLASNGIAVLPALLPFDVPGPALNFAGLTGLQNRWVELTPNQLVDTNYFNAANFPLAFYVGDDDYVANVNTNGDGTAAVIQYLAGGGMLVVLSEDAFPFQYPCDGSDDCGAADPLLPTLGIPLGKAFGSTPAGAYVTVCTNEVSLPSVPPEFSFPSGYSLYSINRQSLNSTNLYVPWLEVWSGGAMSVSYGDAAGYFELHTGPGQGGRVLYIANPLLSGSAGQTLMGDAISWLAESIFRAALPPLNTTVGSGGNEVVLSFNAQANLDYALECCDNLATGGWTLLSDLSGAPTNRMVSFTNATTGTAARFFRLMVRP
jgi:hypothetical protein